MNILRLVLTLIFLKAGCLAAFAQSATAPANATPVESAVKVDPATPVRTAASRDKDTLSVDFPDEDLKTILRNVGDLFELNLVVPDTLVGKTSIKLRDVTWRQIFHVVLSPVGYSYIEEGNIIKIISDERLTAEPATTEVYILNNAKAADIKPTIDGLVTGTSGKIVVDSRSNALVITERPSQLKRIAAIIEQLDKATDQVMIESKFVEVTDRDIRNIGVNWASLQGLQLGVSGVNQTWDRGRGQISGNDVQLTGVAGNGATSQNSSGTTNTNTNGTNTSVTNGTSGSTTSGTTAGTTSGNAIVYATTPTPIGLANGVYATSTMNPATGAVSGLPASVVAGTGVANYVAPVVTPGNPPTTTPATFTSVNTFNGTNANGTTASTANGTTSGTTVGTTGTTDRTITDAVANTLSNSATNAVNSLIGLTNSGSTNRLASAVFSSSDFNVIVSALKQQNNSKVVSNPTIVTLNNTEAVINIGQEFPVPSYTYNEQRGSFEVSGFTYKPIGIILKVTPQVNARGVIKLALEPEVSIQNGSTSFGGAGGAQIPIIGTRKVKTQVSLKDGYTMGIGGLISSATSHGGTKVPILGDIPLLGRLFSSKSVNDEATNLLIFITAKTVNADGASPEEVFDPRAVQAIGMSREDMPGNRTPKGADMFAPVSANKK
ncbi:MAG: secretin N-terminal domain-containing protein [Opitutaceae bacterium]|jgi:type II secretory pathway component GspD/PulD (secretin)